MTQTLCLALLSLITQVEAKRSGFWFLLIIFTDENGNVSGWGSVLLTLSVLISFCCCFCHYYGKSSDEDEEEKHMEMSEYEMAKRQYEMEQQELKSS